MAPGIGIANRSSTAATPLLASKKRRWEPTIESTPALALPEWCPNSTKSMPSLASPMDSDAVSLSSHASNTSASLAGKCHVCQTASGFEVLVLCTTCPRRFHHRCHSNPAIPADTGRTQSDWQCARCSKKGVAKRKVPEVTAAKAESPGKTSGDPRISVQPAKETAIDARGDILPQVDCAGNLEVPESPHGAAAASPMDIVLPVDEHSSAPTLKVGPPKSTGTVMKRCTRCGQKVFKNRSDPNTLCTRCKLDDDEQVKARALQERGDTLKLYSISVATAAKETPPDFVENMQQKSDQSVQVITSMITQTTFPDRVRPEKAIVAYSKDLSDVRFPFVCTADRHHIVHTADSLQHRGHDEKPGQRVVVSTTASTSQTADAAALRAFDGAVYGIRTVDENEQNDCISASIARIRSEVAKREYMERSFYPSWPEYRPQTEADEDSSPVKKRPSRKAFFGRAAVGRKNGLVKGVERIRPSEKICSGQSGKKNDENARRIYYKSIDELLGVPTTVIPMLSDDRLAFRDGTRDADEKLPRPKVIYQIGNNI